MIADQRLIAANGYITISMCNVMFERGQHGQTKNKSFTKRYFMPYLFKVDPVVYEKRVKSIKSTGSILFSPWQTHLHALLWSHVSNFLSLEKSNSNDDDDDDDDDNGQTSRLQLR